MLKLSIFLVIISGLVWGDSNYMKEVAAIRKELTDKKGINNQEKEITILNVSYDPTREFYEEFDEMFAKYWKEKTGQEVIINQSHGGSGSQARAVIEGLDADVVALALAYDIDAIVQKGQLLSQDWRKRLPNESVPFTSTIVFLVSKGNPKNIRDWDDLIRKDVSVITPNPKISGGARWNYLAAWGYAKSKYHDDEAKILEFMTKLYNNVPILDVGARRSTTTFVQNNIGDVLIAWENEAHLAVNEFGKDKYEIVRPSITIQTDPPVALIDKNVAKKNTKDVAEYYLKFLYSKEGQELAAKHYFRPIDPEIAAKYTENFPPLQSFTVDSLNGGWDQAQHKHFAEGGTFDKIYKK